MKLAWAVVALGLAACGERTTFLGEQLAEALPNGGEGSQAASGGAAGAVAMASFFVRYEAEAAGNTLTYPVQSIDGDMDACPPDGVVEGAMCASGGRIARYIMGRSPCQPPTSRTSYDECENLGGGVTFNDVTVPVAGSYDVTWWYHCGADPSRPGRASVYGDTACGGIDYGTGAGSGCRSHMIDVNGVNVATTIDGQTAPYFHFPCYPTDWKILHGVVTSLALNAGPNTLYIHAPGATMLDASDIDALDVRTAGQGSAEPPLWPKLITPVVEPN